MLAAAVVSASALASAMHTFIPRPANFRAAARPMPLAAPVMTATRPGGESGMGHGQSYGSGMTRRDFSHNFAGV